MVIILCIRCKLSIYYTKKNKHIICIYINTNHISLQLRNIIKDGDKKELEKLEVYDLQFKFARRETMEDEEMIVCDIPHQSIATSALTGYHLKIWVTEKSKYIHIYIFKRNYIVITHFDQTNNLLYNIYVQYIHRCWYSILSWCYKM